MSENVSLSDLRNALAEVPEKYHAEVSRQLTHDVGVIARTINMVSSEKNN